MKLLVFDNYDSFTYNLVHAFRNLGVNPTVVRNDEIAVEDASPYDKIVISPGPGIPEESGILLPLLARWKNEKPILGVCLGHQALAMAFGAGLYNLPDVYHGVATPITITDTSDYLFEGLDSGIEVGRYHSWAVDKATLPKEIVVTATDEAGIIMALRHRDLDIRGVQFHPESLLTPQGERMLYNWIRH